MRRSRSYLLVVALTASALTACATPQTTEWADSDGPERTHNMLMAKIVELESNGAVDVDVQAYEITPRGEGISFAQGMLSIEWDMSHAMAEKGLCSALDYAIRMLTAAGTTDDSSGGSGSSNQFTVRSFECYPNAPLAFAKGHFTFPLMPSAEPCADTDFEGKAAE